MLLYITFFRPAHRQSYFAAAAYYAKFDLRNLRSMARKMDNEYAIPTLFAFTRSTVVHAMAAAQEDGHIGYSAVAPPKSPSLSVSTFTPTFHVNCLELHFALPENCR